MKYRIIVVAVLLLVGGLVARPRPAVAALLRVIPELGSYGVGERVVVTIVVDTEDQAINAAEASITWDDKVLTLQHLSQTSTIFQYWAFEPVQRSSTSAFFSGGLPDPGFNGSAGTIVQLEFLARNIGMTSVQITEGKVLANDGTATSLLTSQEASAIEVTARPLSTELTTFQSPTIRSDTYTNQQAWYHDAAISLAWTEPIDSQGFSYSLSTDPVVEPGETVSTTGRGTTVSMASDGLWYFRVRAKYRDGWSASSRYVLRYDHTPPKAFTPTVTQDRGPSDPTPVVAFATTDTMSGLAIYTMSIDGGPIHAVVSPHVLEGLPSGTHEIAITAADLAGNTQVGKATFTTSGTMAPTITQYSNPLQLLEPLVVRGLARVGDTVMVMVNGEPVATAVAGPTNLRKDDESIAVLVPWVVSVPRQFRPGQYQLTASAQDQSGQVSASTDPVNFHVSGQSIIVRGQAIATIAVVTPVAVLLLSLAVLILSVMARLILAVVLMHRHIERAEDEVEQLRGVNARQPVSRQQLDATLERIEEDLEGGDVKRVRKIQRRRARKTKRS